MKKHTLHGIDRTETGRKVKTLRRTGNIPGTVYGKKVKSVNVAVKTDDFVRVYQEAGETGVVEFLVGKDSRPVLIHHVQRDPVDGSLLHIEFYQVDLKEKVRTKVPLETAGESQAVSEKRGVLLMLLDEVEVEALPSDLPDKLTLDVSGLQEVGQEARVSGLNVPAGVTILTDADLPVVKIGALVSKEAEAQAAEDAKVAAEATDAAGASEVAGESSDAASSEKSSEKQEESSKPQS